MKRVSFLFIGVSFFCTCAFSDNHISIGTNSCSAFFIDAVVPADVQSVVCADLSRYFSYNQNLNMVFDMDERTNNFPLSPICDSRHATNMMDNVELAKLADGTYEIRIAKDLTDSYQYIQGQNPFALTQISNAVAFVSTFNSGAVTNYSESDKCRLFRTLESPSIPTQIEEITAGLTSYWCTHKYSLPAIIDLRRQTVWVGHPDIPVVPVRVCSSQTTGVLSSATHYIGAISNEWFFIAY